MPVSRGCFRSSPGWLNVLLSFLDGRPAATFVILAHKAGSIRDGAALAGWLQATAYRVALRAKRDAAIRRAHERRGQPMPADWITTSKHHRRVEATAP